MEICLIFSLLIILKTRALLAAGPDFSCTANSLSSHCKTYVAYHAKSPKYLDLSSISDLFGVSCLSIVQASNLASEDEKLSPNQLVLIPIDCGCSGNSYLANVTYEIEFGDSYYLVATRNFENLTDWYVMEKMNQDLNPNLLQIGAKVTVPLFCKCPTNYHHERGIEYLITYVWQSGDRVPTVAARFAAEPSNIIEENNQQAFDGLMGNPVLIPLSKLSALSQPVRSKPKGKEPSDRTKKIIVFVGAVGGSFFILSLVGLSVYLYRSRERKGAAELEHNKSNTKSMEHNFPYVNVMSLGCKGSCSMETTGSTQLKDSRKDKKFAVEPRRTVQDKLLPCVSDYLSRPTVYHPREIMEATMNFHQSFRVGGSVYRAMINRKVFAIKKIKDWATDELNILQQVNHANLVKLMGVSAHLAEDRFLVYEYAENGSLDRWLYRKNTASSKSLTWSQRLQIALGVAKGLQYLHEHTHPSILHGDLQSSNVLLDSKFKAKISNFSKAKPISHTANLKTDIFSFGVILLELLSGRKALERKDNGVFAMVLDQEEKREESLRSWMDPSLEDFYPIDTALSLARLATACTLEKSSARPSMAEIVFNLCVLAQTCSGSGTLERSWTSRTEVEEEVEVINPIIAR